MIRVDHLADTARAVCAECGRHWWQAPPDNPYETRPMARISGTLGGKAIKLVLCPSCFDDAARAIFAGAGGLYDDDREWKQDEEWGFILATAPDLSEMPPHGANLYGGGSSTGDQQLGLPIGNLRYFRKRA